MTKDEVTAQIRDLFAAWNAHDADAIARFYTTAATVRDSAEPANAASGSDAIAARARERSGWRMATSEARPA